MGEREQIVNLNPPVPTKSPLPKAIVQHLMTKGKRGPKNDRWFLETPLCQIIFSDMGRLTILDNEDAIVAQATNEEWPKGMWLTKPNWFRVEDHIRCLVYGDPSTANERVSKQIAEFMRDIWKRGRGDAGTWGDGVFLNALDKLNEGTALMIENRLWDPTKGEP